MNAAGFSPPDAFGPFRTVHQVGEGALGPVFRADDSARERIVAVKVFKLGLPPDRLQQLAAGLDRIVALSLPHPVIVPSIAAGTDGVITYVVREFVSGSSLDVVLREQGVLRRARALQVITEVADALDRAAAAGVVHGALHPRDLLMANSVTRLSDLGVAAVLEDVGVPRHVRPPYTAPERAAGGPWDRRADIFSLAAIAYELMWGKRLSAIGAEAAEALTDLPGGNLAWLRPVFARGLALNPIDRFETALLFADALVRAVPAGDAEDDNRSVAGRRASAGPSADRTVKPSPDARRAPRGAPAGGGGLDALSLDPIRAAESPSTPPSVAPGVGSALQSEDLPLLVESARDIPGRTASVLADDLQLHAAAIAYDDIAAVVTPEETAAARTFDAPPAELRAAPSLAAAAPNSPSLFDLHGAGPLPEVQGPKRSGVWPFLVLLGIAAGFVGGYVVADRERLAQTRAALAPPVRASASDPLPGEARGRETTNGAAGIPTPSSAAPTPPAPAAEARTGREEAGPLAQPPASDSATQATPFRGRVLLRSIPSRARVFVDGAEQGRTPATVESLTAGPHQIRVALEGYMVADRRITVTPGTPMQTLTIELERPGRMSAAPRPDDGPSSSATAGTVTGALSVESRPVGASVFVDERLIGTTPLLVTVGTGSHVVRLELEGFRRWTSSVRVVGGASNRVRASLEER